MLQELDGYDWYYAFEYAGEVRPDAWYSTYGSPDLRRAVPGDEVELTPFGRDNVVELLGLSEGENDGPEWLAAGRLDDGRWFMLRAGCDYTGWDCQAGGMADVASSKEVLIKHALTKEEKERLGLS